MANATIKDRKIVTGYAFPEGPTLGVGIWLLVFAISIFILLYLEIGKGFISHLFYRSDAGNELKAKISESIIVLFAAGLGAWITAVRGFLKHACNDKDFESAYIPWYIARLFQGMLLGLVFYFAIRGGLLVLTLETENTVKPTDLNDLALAAIASLVGLFSKNAIEKLRELFHTLFASKEEVREQVKAENIDNSDGAK